jgi:multisubunit Na+/H+ antiporter MnhG subunit
MSLVLKIYLFGCFIAFIELIGLYRDKDGMIDWVELIVSIFVSALSWLIALALFIGANIKQGQKDDDDKDIFGNDNLAGT